MNDSTKNKNVSIIISVISLAISFLTLLFAYLKPLIFDKPEVQYVDAKELSVMLSLGGIQLGKHFSVINSGKKEVIINDIDAYIVAENKSHVFPLRDIYYVSNPSYLSNDKLDKFQKLNGLTLWQSQGYSNELFFLNDFPYSKNKDIEEITDSARSEKEKSFIPIVNLNDQAGPDISESLKDRIFRVQSEIEQMVKPGNYYFIERITASDGKKYYQGYAFQITNDDFRKFENLRLTKFYKKLSLNLTATISTDLKPVSKEVRNKIVERIESFEENN